jgi:uncharacterized protein (DUF983 family)
MAKKRKKPSKPNAPRPPAKSKCRDCGRTATIPRYEHFKAARPRCSACGGAMEYLGTWRGVPRPDANK